MSLVTTAMSSRSRSRLHSRSTSAVLPEPTGPPTPTRNTSARLDVDMVTLRRRDGAMETACTVRAAPAIADSVSGGVVRAPAQRALERVGFDRFHQVFVEPGRAGARLIVGLAVTGECDQAGMLQPRHAADASRHFIAVP